MSTGGRAVESLPHPLPDNVRVATYLPYDQLLPRTDVFVSNGGYGGVHYALEHGVPLVVAGTTEDKAEVTARVEWSGAGVNLRTNRPTSDQVADAVRLVLDDPGYRKASAAIGAQIAAAPGLDGLERVIDAARRRRRPQRDLTHVAGAHRRRSVSRMPQRGHHPNRRPQGVRRRTGE